jgi:hypothetical protein
MYKPESIAKPIVTLGDLNLEYALILLHARLMRSGMSFDDAFRKMSDVKHLLCKNTLHSSTAEEDAYSIGHVSVSETDNSITLSAQKHLHALAGAVDPRLNISASFDEVSCLLSFTVILD